MGLVNASHTSTESESEESEQFHFLPITAYESDACDPVTRLFESQAEAEAQEPTNHNAEFILWLPLMTLTI